MSVQRYLSARSLKGMQKSFVLNTVGGWSMGILMIWIGLGLYAFYTMNPGQLPEAIGGDKVFPYFIATEMPLGLRGVMVAAILAAAMSSIDSGLNSCTTALVTDFFKRFGWLTRWATRAPQGSAAQELRISRILTL